MARAPESLYHAFRFAPRIGLDGPMIGVMKVEVVSDGVWSKGGTLKIESAIKKDFIDLLKHTAETMLSVALFSIDDEFGVNGAPSAALVFYGVTPSQAKLTMIPLDAHDSSIFTGTAELRYDRMDILFGDLGMLDAMSSAVIQA